jgi:hypothetical protein
MNTPSVSPLPAKKIAAVVDSGSAATMASFQAKSPSSSDR